MLDSKGFDLWSDGYDKSVNLCEESNDYPFAGYKDVLNTVYAAVMARGSAAVLDIGLGTGVLTKKLYDAGCSIYGVDFSEKMIAIAQEKMPNAVLVRHDFSEGVPEQFQNKLFDAILCTYAIHHLTDAQKYAFIAQLLDRLRPEGEMLIGDVAFETRDDLNKCKAACGEDGWDDDEFYVVFDETARHFKNAIFKKITFCSGVIVLKK